MLNTRGQGNFLGQMAASGSAQLPDVSLGSPSPGSPAVSPGCRSRSPLCTPNTPQGEASIKGWSVAPRFSLGKDPFPGGNCPSPSADTCVLGREQAPGSLEDECSLLLPLLSALAASPGGLVQFQLNWSHCSPSAARTSCVQWACLPPFFFLSKSLSLLTRQT